MPVDFINTGDEVDYGAVAATGNLAQMTVEAWVYMDAVGAIEIAEAPGYAIAQYEQGSADGKGWAFGNRNTAGEGITLAVYWYRGFSGDEGAWYANNALTAQQWQHIAVSHDASNVNNNPVMFVDGISKPVTEFGTPTGVVQDASGEDLKIGAIDAGGVTLTYNGKIAPVGVYDSILSATDIASSANMRSYKLQAPLPIFRPSLLGAAGLQTFDGASLGAGNKLIDDISGLLGTPAGNPVGLSDTFLSYGGGLA